MRRASSSWPRARASAPRSLAATPRSATTARRRRRSSRTRRTSSIPSRAGLDRSVAAPVALGDRVGVLVPVPRARVLRVVLGRVGRIERVARPLDRQGLVHEAAVGAVEGEALAPIGPIVRLARAAAVGKTLVGAAQDEPLTRAAGGHREGHPLLVL